MLDTQTKKTIDNARDILVGKVPNPLSQIDLITTAMIYKFMDDMDLDGISMGGERVFFVGELEKYAWSKLLSPTVGNNERLNLYTEALDKLPYAKNIPQLFRNIFKGAFLPFRDAITLTMFLQEVNNLTYDDSENLGDAFEYLLSIMSSQGDAGQFRTPRHIIDFIVEIVNPTKTDTILDPACGTSGFLISAYKHILNTAKMAKKPLSVEEIKTITQNITGYDIDPTMQKLSLVNLYLHRFATPRVYEYDTLSSDDRWGDKFDVILANPPFMTPKGGIRPHNKFGVKASRSEVLFVDYFMEHLNLNGKAGFIVPEGIIFQSGKAYKDLRKMMVEDNYLYAVVSLPNGVFNPYAGVKTSLLFFDRELAKKTKDILFVKVDKDGYDLGAQRRPIKDNDLPEAVELLKLWQKSITSGTIDEKISKSKRVTIVSKEKLAEDGEYNLSASRYQETQDFSNCQYDMVKLGDVCQFLGGFAFKSDALSNIPLKEKCLPVIKIGNIGADGKLILDEKSIQYHRYNEAFSKYLIEKYDIIVAMTGATVGKAAVSDRGDLLLNQRNGIIRCGHKVNKGYIKHLLLSSKFYEYCQNNAGGGAQGNISPKQIQNYEIPLPPMSVQEEIVKELDAYQAIIDGAQKVVDNWKPTFTINPTWKKVKLGDICEKITDGSHFSPQTTNEGYPYITVKDITEDSKIDLEHCKYVNQDDFIVLKNNGCSPSKGDVLFSKDGTVGKTALVTDDIEFVVLSSLAILTPNNDAVMTKYLFYYLGTDRFIQSAVDNKTGIAIKRIVLKALKELQVSLPPLEEQQAIVAKIEQEEKYVDACKKLIELNKQKIADKIKSIWNSEE